MNESPSPFARRFVEISTYRIHIDPCDPNPKLLGWESRGFGLDVAQDLRAHCEHCHAHCTLQGLIGESDYTFAKERFIEEIANFDDTVINRLRIGKRALVDDLILDKDYSSFKLKVLQTSNGSVLGSGALENFDGISIGSGFSASSNGTRSGHFRS